MTASQCTTTANRKQNIQHDGESPFNVSISL